MGCGRSKIGIIYPRKSKNKDGGKKTGSDPEVDENADEEDAESCPADETSDENIEANKAKQLFMPPGGPLLAQAEISSSQLNFFRMLDEKIENGPDYNSSSEEELAQERARIASLLREWQAASRQSRPVPYSSPYVQPNGNPCFHNQHYVPHSPYYQYHPQRMHYPPSSPQQMNIPQYATSVVQYRKSRGAFTELA